MANELETPEGFPDVEDVGKGDKRKFIVETECTGKEDDGSMKWEVKTIDGVKVDPQAEEDAEEDDAMDEYDTSGDEGGSEDVTPDGKAKTTKGVGMLILSGKPK